VVGPEGYDPQAELAELHSAIAAKPAGILISVADAAVLQPEIDAAVNAGIPVITMDSDAAGSRRLYFIGTNNLEAGRLGGRRVLEKLGGKGNVVVFTIAGQPNTDERLKGLKDVFATRPDVKIVNVIDIKGDVRVAFDKTQELMALTGSQKIDAFVCLESASGKLVADAVKRGGGGRVLVAWDVNQDTLDGIKDGTIDSTVAQKPFTMGYASDSFSPYPVFVDTGTSLVDQSNVDRYIAAAAEGTK
jgi:ribose transport system substrate-binding protein